MQLRELTLHDFRTYGGRQTILLEPVDRDKPVVLIGGLNGAGKTTLLDALQLVLYGARARCASRGEMGYRAYLRQAIHRRADPSEGAGLELSFTHASEGQEHEYRVRRTWYATQVGISERVEVEVDGRLDPVLTEQWEERVDDFAPHRIAHLFFFDGEKIAALAESESSAEVLRTAVHSLLGLELVDRLMGDLAILDQKKRRGGNIDFDRAKAEQLEVERVRLTAELEAATQERATLLNQVDRAEKALSKVRELYSQEGGDLAEQRNQLEGQHRAVDAARAGKREMLRELTLGALPLAAVRSLLVEVDEQAHAETEASHREMIANLLVHRDEEVLARLRDSGTAKKMLDQLASLLREDRGSRAVSRSGASFLGLDVSEVRQLDRLLQAELPSQVDQARALCGELELLAEQSLVLERKLRSIPEEGDLVDLRERRTEAIRLVESLRAQLEALEERVRVLRSQLETTTEQYRRELERELLAAQTNDGLYRKLERIQQASKALDLFRGVVLERNLGRLEAAILESFHDLIRKPNLVTRLRIDAEDFSLRLTGADEQGLEQVELSAGESQLLAVSILWGLARTTGLPLPVVIDTPLGRLDSEHRGKLVGRYFPKASHQVLLLSTDEEIKENRLVELEPFIGQSYLLEYNEDEKRTLVHPGYFRS